MRNGDSGAYDYSIVRPGRLVGGPYTNLDLAKLTTSRFATQKLWNSIAAPEIPDGSWLRLGWVMLASSTTWVSELPLQNRVAPQGQLSRSRPADCSWATGVFYTTIARFSVGPDGNTRIG